MKVQHQTAISAYQSGGFIGNYQRLIKDVVIPYQYSVLCDEVKDAEKSHVVQNFIYAGKALQNTLTDAEKNDGFYGFVFQDSDAAKWLEAVAYSLALFPDKELEETADKLIDIIAAAQDEDGYLDTYFTIKDRDRRWTNLQEAHELYCAGHMMEAACAYYETTGKDKLLKVMQKNTRHIYQIFITQGQEGFPGHPEVELALLKMYHLTGEEHCLKLAGHFINVRGKDSRFYEKEAEKRGWFLWDGGTPDTDYSQASEPVRSQKDAVGHAVRAVYLYTAMADLASSTDDKDLLQACRSLWESITRRRMYLTGGIGSTVIGEAFTKDYDLPGDTAYAETCASIGLMFFASRMLESDVNGEYGDICERAFYNTILGSIQLDGKRFFYVNPLEVIPGITGEAATHKHVLPMRPKWHACACCPPNAARLISSFGKYAYGENEDTAFCHMFADGKVTFENGMELICRTKYPYDFTIDYQIEKGGKLAVRIPGWSKTWKVCINDKEIGIAPQKGYVYLTVADNDTVRLTLDGTPKFQYASSKVPHLTGKTAICRGPLVYCFEGADNEEDIVSLSLKRDGALTVSDYEKSLLGGIVTITADALRQERTDSLYTDQAPVRTSCKAVAIPYYTWGNRHENQMRVWMNETVYC